ncbi:TetR family transcriptional regulator [Glaciibacter psychrotolerans]|nr:TetR family transcriptional regulator [Leifsonia psychrotolerans]
MRAELAESAFEFFAAHGFDPVTVDEVAHGIGISRASFFRYFGSKEEAVFAAVHSSPFGFASILQSLERRNGENSWWLLRRMFASSVADAESRPDVMRVRIRMINSTPSLHARLTEKRVSARSAVAEVLAEAGIDPLAARALVATSFALFDVAWSEWSTSPERSLSLILDELFESFAPVSADKLG